jgi:hypothetical protein
MTSVTSIRTDDVDRMFADWGEPVILKRVDQLADPSTGMLSETESNVVVTAIVKPREIRPISGPAHQHSTITTSFLVRAAELPGGLNLSTSRIVHDGFPYSVLGSETSGDGLTVTILGQRV